MTASPGPRTAGPGDRAPAPSATHSRERTELARLQEQLREAHETIEAIRTGEVDSLVVGPPGQEQVYVLASADRPYRLIFETMNEGAATVSPRGVILDANPRLGQMTGFAVADLVGAQVLDLADAAHRAAFGRLLDLQPGQSARGEIELARPDSVAVSALLAVSAFDLDGMLLRSLVLTDLTAQRRAEAEIRALNAGLEQRVAQRTADLARANESLESFTYSVSHDLRAPLRAMSGFSEALVEEYGDRLDETGRDYAERIQAASERMAALIDDLLSLSQVSRAELKLGPVDLSAEVTAVADDLRSREPGRRVRFRIQDGVVATADQGLIRTVVQNLVENAWKFTARTDGATIEFAATPAGEAGLTCHVRDNGVGFDPAYTDQLFQPFRRLHPAREYPGTGVGLASVARIIERHGGRTWAEGAVGRGATFFFTLPAHPATLPSHPTPAEGGS